MHLLIKRWWFEIKQRIFALDLRVYAGVGVILFLGIFGWVSQAQAFPTSSVEVLNWFVSALGQLVGLVSSFVANLLLLMVDILIAFASYNDFVKAQPVVIGWVLVRDIVNMFFIVVLLVSAFSTIVGYKVFHYKGILPKLLVMAVLINFSRTLIGLMIDFSQVVMLTFVSAFSAAAGGNFVTALKLDKITKLEPNLSEPGETYDILSLFVASILGIVMLGIALTVITIMTAFIAFRIVGLWILLILSPIAFFALALPDKMARALSTFTSKFWSKLSTFLIAGPVLAFFLWLTLAVVQNPGAGGAFGETLTSMEPKDTLNVHFVTAIGNASDIGQFVVAIVLLLSGLEFAMESAQAVSPGLGKLAGMIKSGGGPAVHLARGLAKVTGKAARVGAAGVDRAFDVKGMVGRKGLAMAQKLPGAPGAAMFAGMATARGKAVREKEASIEKNIEGLSMADQMKLHQAGLKSVDPVTRRAHEKAMARKSAASPGRQVLVDEEYSKLSHVTDEKERKLQAEAKAEGRVSSALQTGRNAALAVGDEKGVSTIDELIKKNPGRAADFKSALSNAEATYDSSKDIASYVASYGQDAFKTSQGTMAILKAGGGLSVDGSVNEKSKIMEYLKEKGGPRFDLVNQHAQQVANMTPEERAILNKGMDANATDEEKKAAKGLEGYASRDGYVRMSAIGSGAVIKPTTSIRNDVVINQGKEKLKAFADAKKPANDPEVIAAKQGMLAAGAKIGEAFKHDAKAGFADKENRQAFEISVKNTIGGQDLNAIAAMDMDTLRANPGEYNEAREVAVGAMDVNALQQRYQEALKAENQMAMQKISEFLKLASEESQRNSKLLDTAVKNGKLSGEDRVVIKRYASGMSQALPSDLLQRMEQGAGVSMDGINAMRSDKIIDRSPQQRAIRGAVGDKAFAAAHKSAGTVAKGARGVKAAAVATADAADWLARTKEQKAAAKARKQAADVAKMEAQAEQADQAAKRGAKPPKGGAGPAV